MIENIVRHLEVGEKSLQAALRGALSAMLGLLESFVKGLRSGKPNGTEQGIIKNLPSPSALSLEFACIPDLSNRDLGMGSTPKFSRNRERKPGTAGSVRQLIARYPGEWLAIELKAEEEGRPKAGRVVCHAKDRDAVWRKTKSRRRLYIVYAGPPPREGAQEDFHHYRERESNRAAPDLGQGESAGKSRGEVASHLSRPPRAEPSGRAAGPFVSEVV